MSRRARWTCSRCNVTLIGLNLKERTRLHGSDCPAEDRAPVPLGFRAPAERSPRVRW